MTVKIDEKIIGVSVAAGDNAKETNAPMTPYDRPQRLYGVTEKIKPPVMEAALYVTINDIDCPDGKRPLEIFLNSKDVTHAEWMVSVSRLLSAIFRLPVPFDFAIEELKQVVSPNGSYFIPGGGGRCGGIVSHIARVLEAHCLEIGAIKKPEMSEEARAALAEKKNQAQAADAKANICPKCSEFTYYFLDNCWSCVSCGHSKCD